jgi:hypothetical protein
MKLNMSITALVFIISTMCLATSCEIESQINKAANKCEDKISKVLESVEKVCLTKEEILELINSYQNSEDASGAGLE